MRSQLDENLPELLADLLRSPEVRRGHAARGGSGRREGSRGDGAVKQGRLAIVDEVRIRTRSERSRKASVLSEKFVLSVFAFLGGAMGTAVLTSLQILNAIAFLRVPWIGERRLGLKPVGGRVLRRAM